MSSTSSNYFTPGAFLGTPGLFDTTSIPSNYFGATSGDGYGINALAGISSLSFGLNGVVSGGNTVYEYNNTAVSNYNFSNSSTNPGFSLPAGFGAGAEGFGSFGGFSDTFGGLGSAVADVGGFFSDFFFPVPVANYIRAYR